MPATEARILTIQWDSRTGIFDDSVLRTYLINRELIRCVPEFFENKGRPYWSLYIESNLLVGGETTKSMLTPAPGYKSDISVQIAEFDEIQQVRYDRILLWRREVAQREGLKSYMICTNRQALDLARNAPATLSALAMIHGFGEKKVARYGRQMLEILHGNVKAPGDPGGVRKMDADDKGFLSDFGGLSETVAGNSDQPDGEPVPGDSGTSDGRSIHPESDTNIRPD